MKVSQRNPVSDHIVKIVAIVEQIHHHLYPCRYDLAPQVLLKSSIYHSLRHDAPLRHLLFGTTTVQFSLTCYSVGCRWVHTPAIASE
jgi:hypothetical protein